MEVRHPCGKVGNMTLIWKTDDEVKASPRAEGSARLRATALELRRHPNTWAELPYPATYAKLMREGTLSAFRPAGHFESLVRDGKVMARYVGPDRGEAALALPPDRRTKHDHAGLRRELVEKVLAGEVPLSYRDWPKSYGTRIQNGGLGYTPAGAYRTRWTRRMGLEIALVASDGIYGQLAEKNGFPATAAEAAPAAAAAEALARPSTSAEAAAAAVAAVAAGVEPDDSDWSEEDYAAYEAAMWADAGDTEQEQGEQE